MWQMAIVLSVVAACGGDDAGPVSGTSIAPSMSVTRSISAAVTINSNQHRGRDRADQHAAPPAAS